MRQNPTWIVLANGRSARFFRRARRDEALQEFTNLADSTNVLEKGDAEGQTLSLAAGCQLPPEWFRHQRADGEKTFLRRIAAAIDQTLFDHPATSLVLCAPARELGLLRGYISARTRAKLTCEVAKDLAGAKLAHVEALVGHLKV